MNIKEMKQYSRDCVSEILSVANSIHPKLLSVIQFRDIYDDSLMNRSLLDRYNSQVLPLVKAYEKEFREMKVQYITQAFEDFMEYSDYDDYGINLKTGAWLDNAKAWTDREEVDFMPRVEVQAIYDGVMYLHSNRASLKPFWEHSRYMMISDDKKATVSSSSTPDGFIRACRSMFVHSNKNVIYKVLESAKLATTFDYDIHLEPLTQYDERNIVNSTIIIGVQRHAKLRDFLESSIDKNMKCYSSTFDGTKHTFRGEG